jgi:2-oxoglutarate dehydrogenase E1 component
MLRHKAAVSPVADFASGTFQPLIGDATASPEKTKRVLFVSGKFFYSLLEARIAQGADDTAIVRVEQMYPFPDAEVRAELERFANASDVCWVQEEPENMGAWRHLRHRFDRALPEGRTLRVAARQDASTPASGFYGMHQQQEQALIADAFSPQAVPSRAGRKSARGGVR